MNKLRQARKQMGLTQKELAEKAGISRVTISGLESGRVVVMKTSTMAKIADAMQKSVKEIFF